MQSNLAMKLLMKMLTRFRRKHKKRGQVIKPVPVCRSAHGMLDLLVFSIDDSALMVYTMAKGSPMMTQMA